MTSPAGSSHSSVYNGSAVQISSNHIHFFISYAVAFLAFALIGRWYIWPAIKDRAPAVALSPLLLYAWVNGLMFLMPGLVSPDLPRAFAVPTVALLTLAALRSGSPLGLPMVWLFNLFGFLDLAYANLATFTANVDPAQLGTSYYLAVVNVPAMLVVHVIIFIYLFPRQPSGSLQTASRAARHFVFRSCSGGGIVRLLANWPRRSTGLS